MIVCENFYALVASDSSLNYDGTRLGYIFIYVFYDSLNIMMLSTAPGERKKIGTALLVGT